MPGAIVKPAAKDVTMDSIWVRSSSWKGDRWSYGIPKCDTPHWPHSFLVGFLVGYIWIYWICGGRTERRAFLVSLLLAGHLQLGPQTLAGQFGAILGHKSYWWCNIQVHPITSRYESIPLYSVWNKNCFWMFMVMLPAMIPQMYPRLPRSFTSRPQSHLPTVANLNLS